MTKNDEDRYVIIEGEKIKRPDVARTCFTELRLSDAQEHAKKFGSLGIGFKRFFLFERLGSPMVYFHPIRRNYFFPPLFQGKIDGHLNSYFMCFLKPM